ncbi:hypothetical protein TrispH2_003532 [Trichoplax sp. H2]|nr:hypothetical protein TrispH2_003532 [Trichoplax sp. H2]|eukprot:RDD45585.1 hypothetical protein TrispH2_003532 [Trichoplax sp. H2]
MLRHAKLRTHRHSITISALVTAILFSILYILPRFTYYTVQGDIIQPRSVRLGLFSRIGQTLFLSLNIHIFLRSIQMYMMICHPLNGIVWLNRQNLSILLIIVWGITIAIPLGSQIYFEILIYNLDESRIYQYIMISLQFVRIFSIFLAAFSLIVLLVLIFAYAKVYSVANKAAHEIRKLSIGRTRSNSLIPKLRKRSKAMFQVLTIYSCYIIFWMPFLIIILYSQFLRDYNREQTPEERQLLDRALRSLQYIAFLFPAIQPILFAVFTADIYHELVVSWRRKVITKKACINN